MKQDFKTVRARYEKPALKEFSISMEGYVCLSGDLQDVQNGGEISNDF